MFSRPDPSSGIPVYLQLVEQVKHAIATGAILPGQQLPGVRPAAVELVINPNTVVKAYRELEHEGFIEVRHGAGAFVSPSAPSLLRTDLIRDAVVIVREAVEELRTRGVTPAEIRRLLESELAQVRVGEARDSELRESELRESELRESELRESELRVPEVERHDAHTPEPFQPELRNADGRERARPNDRRR